MNNKKIPPNELKELLLKNAAVLMSGKYRTNSIELMGKTKQDIAGGHMKNKTRPLNYIKKETLLLCEIKFFNKIVEIRSVNNSNNYIIIDKMKLNETNPRDRVEILGEIYIINDNYIFDNISDSIVDVELFKTEILKVIIKK